MEHGKERLQAYMQIVDANIILRYILDDNETLSLKSRRIIDENVVEVPIEVLCEVVFVLSSVYKVERDRISLELLAFFENTSCELHHREAVLKGLELFSKNNLDFVDCILAGYRIILKAQVYTFDNKLLKVLNLSKAP